MKLIDLRNEVEENFEVRYTHFLKFKNNEELKFLWQTCLNSLLDLEFMIGSKFSNDYMRVPPVKSFLLYYHSELSKHYDSRVISFTAYEKQCLGAFFGMVYKFCLGYEQQQNTTVSLKEKDLETKETTHLYNLNTATYYACEDVKTTFEL